MIRAARSMEFLKDSDSRDRCYSVLDREPSASLGLRAPRVEPICLEYVRRGWCFDEGQKLTRSRLVLCGVQDHAGLPDWRIIPRRNLGKPPLVFHGGR